MNNGQIPVFPFAMYSPDPYFDETTAEGIASGHAMEEGTVITVTPMDEHRGWYSASHPDPYAEHE
jgi:hypothetical protein